MFNNRSRLFPGSALSLLGLFACLTPFLGGCSSGNSKTALAPQGNTAFRAAAIATDQSLNGGVSYPFAILKMTAPKNSPIGKAVSSARLAANSFTNPPPGALPDASNRISSRAAHLTYNSLLNLYAADPAAAGSVVTINYYTDAAGTQSAGALTISQPGTTGVSTDYPSYPVTVNGNISLTAGNLPCKGSVAIVYSGSSGANTLTGHLDLTKTSISIDIHFTLSEALEVGGTAVIKENGQTINVSNISGPLTSTLQCKVNVAPYGWTGTGTFSLLNGTFTMNVNTGTGTDAATVDGSGNLNVSYADGKSEVVNAPLLAALLGDSNSSGSGTGSGSGSGTGGSGTGGNGSAAYNAPVVLVLPPGFDSIATPQAITSNNIAIGLTGNATGIYATAWTSANHAVILPPLQSTPGTPDTHTNAMAGNATQIVGGSGASMSHATPAVWTGTGYTPQALQNSDPNGIATAINAGGQIVGVGGDIFVRNAIAIGLLSFGNAHALYWSSAAAAPTLLTPLVAGGYAGALSINANGQIVGVAYNAAGTLVPVYWASPTSVPTALTAPFGATSVNVAGIDNAGHIVGHSTTGTDPNTATTTPLLWSSPTAAPTALPLPTGATSGRVLNISGSGLIVGWVNISNTTHGVLWKNQQVEDLNDTLPANSNLLLETAQAVNDQGEILGFAVGNGNLYCTLTPK